MDALAQPEPLSRGIQIGMDIGQQVDPTAIVVAERQLRGWHYPNPDYGRPDDVPVGGEIHYVIRYIKRLPLKTPYPKVAERLAEIYHTLQPPPPPEPPSGDDGQAETFRQRFFRSQPQRHDKRVQKVLVDATGVGKPVVDLIHDQGVRCTAVYLTGGEKATTDGDVLRLAKGLMVSRLQVLLQSRLIHLPPDDLEAQAAAEELLNYEIKITESANLQMGVFKTGAPDDLATALGLACWGEPVGTFTIEAAPQWLADFFLGRG